MVRSISGGVSLAIPGHYCYKESRNWNYPKGGPMPYAHVNGINLHYDVHGQGQPLVFINGLGQPSIAWDPELIQAMAKTHQVITYDNRGVGLSDKPDEPYSIAQFASDA